MAAATRARHESPFTRRTWALEVGMPSARPAGSSCSAPRSQIEAIDMARRGIHNEGARVLQERLEGKAVVDIDTARRLFTLICVLHWG